MLFPLLVLTTATAHAADLTDQPDRLTGDVTIGYSFDQQSLGLVEDEEDVGGTQASSHLLEFRAEMGVAPGVSVFLQFDSGLSQTVSYTDARSMGWNPQDDQGSLLNGTPIESGVDPLTGSGFEGVWVGARGTPFSEKRGARATWLIEMALRTANKTNFYTQNGSGDGGGIFHVDNVFATTRGSTHPYIQASYTRRGGFGESTDDSETPLYDPADSLRMTAGAEFDTWSDLANARALSLEGRMFFAYRSPTVLPSGIFLAEVLPGTDSTPVTRSEHSSFGLGFSLHWTPIAEMEVDFNLDLGWPTPHRIEHPYPVYSSFQSGVVQTGLALTYRYR